MSNSVSYLLPKLGVLDQELFKCEEFLPDSLHLIELVSSDNHLHTLITLLEKCDPLFDFRFTSNAKISQIKSAISQHTHTS